MEQAMKFNVIFYVRNGDTQVRGYTDESWDSEFEFHQSLTQEEALDKATEAYAHNRFAEDDEDYDGALYILPETPSPEAFALCLTIRAQAKVDAKVVIKRRAEFKIQEEKAQKQRAKDEQEARERAELERLQGKFGT